MAASSKNATTVALRLTKAEINSLRWCVLAMASEALAKGNRAHAKKLSHLLDRLRIAADDIDHSPF